MTVLVAPSILSADFTNLERDIKTVEEAGADMIHVDVMDGIFVPNITIGQPVVKAIRKVTRLPLDVHLMIVQPERYIQGFIEAGADILTVHAEACPHLNRVIHQIKEYGIKAGVALNPSTSLTVLDYVLDLVDLVLIMSVNPGFGGQKFIGSTLPKLKTLKTMLKGRDIYVEVDGGITVDNVDDVKKAGANLLVAGSTVYHAHNMKDVIQKLKV